ncbi:MAG: hypothetical protein H7Y33_10465 [Cytophagales bacterium]|nr:hypothetical protein [Rhizobacter sp.]
MVHPTSSVEHTLGLSKAQRTEAASERVRVYVHNKQAAALVVATRWPATKVSRHDVLVKLTVEPSGCFSVEAAGQTLSAGAAVALTG